MGEQSLRVRTGVLLDDDGWWVVQQIGNERRYYGPPSGGAFATQAEATDACAIAVKVLHDRLDTHGVERFPAGSGEGQ